MARFTSFAMVLIATTSLLGWAACSEDEPQTTTDVVADTATETATELAGDTVVEETADRDENVAETTPEVIDNDPGTEVPPVEVLEVAEEGIVEVTPEVECTPNCDGRNCGPDGCDKGGTCGTCTGTDVCDLSTGTCVEKCDWTTDKPTTWGPSGVISALQTPADLAVVQATCFDYTDDGKGDNGLKGLASQVNGPLSDAINGGDIGIVFELAGVTDLANTPSFQLNGLLSTSTATPPVLTGDFVVSEESYIQDTCLPMIYFKGAKIEGSKLTTPPSEFRLSIPVQEGLVIDATLIQAQLKGDIKAGGDLNGFELENGVLSGVLTKQQLQAAVAKLQETCDTTTPKPDFCSYLTVVNSAMGLLFDLHQVGDGTYVPKSKENPGDAASVCLVYGLSKAKIVGFEPTAPAAQ